ncbi:MAG: DUF4330 domain-containing protein [Defluviitaleaceae bacterium]|nr:DUF4330 domain-containing protein [Defluviitaleaceae bacterium]
MDKNGKIFGKISIIDLLVILAILAIIGGVAFRFLSPNAAISRGEAVITYTVRIDQVRDFTLVNYTEGLRVYEAVSNQFIGHLDSFRSEPRMQSETLLNGENIEVALPEHSVLYLTIKSYGRQTDQAIFAGGTFEINAGSWINLATRYSQVFGRIISVEAN